MDQLCTKCGAGVPAGAKFCAACGAPVGTQESAAAASGTPPFTSPPAASGYTEVPPAGASGFAQSPPSGSVGYAPVPPAGAASGYSQSSQSGYAPVSPAGSGPGAVPIAPPPSGGNTAIKVILIIVAIFVGLGILGAGLFGFAVWRVARSVHHNRNGEVSLSTPGGTITANSATSFSAEELGTEVYPGAQSTTGGMKMSLPNGSMVTGVFLTSDTADAVREFYKTKFGSGASVFESDTGSMISMSKSPQDHVMVTISAKPSENEGKTKIVIVHTTENKS